ncbi:MAG: queuosine precursor transporter [Chlamydiales bacterium]|nr:queuosine precursor transporter [Chlamydiales bacterium]
MNRLLIGTTFAGVVLISNLLSAKMVSLPFGLDIPAGLWVYPFAFVLNNLMTELHGARQAVRMIYLTLALNGLIFVVIQGMLLLSVATALYEALKLSGLRIAASLIAYVCSQLVAIAVFTQIRRWTGLSHFWLRLNGSMWIAQLVDTFLIDLIFLYWGLAWDWGLVAPVMLFSFLYKGCFSLILTPLFYRLARRTS